MLFIKTTNLFILLCLTLTSCSSTEEEEIKNIRNQKAEYIYRNQKESLFKTSPPIYFNKKIYPWESEQEIHLPKITKEYFRCKGSCLNPSVTSERQGEIQHLCDCGGQEKHSLPLREGKEFIYPILLELLNAIQNNTKKKVVVSCGHRCPEHNSYADPKREDQYSKHMIGAEVTFYVQGLEDQPEKVVAIIQDFYREEPRYKGQKDYQEFKRYEKEDTNVSTPPWFNKEIYVKLFKMKEGRNFDNRHPYPYISIQVRFDRETNEKVTYSWDKAYRNFHRW